MKKTNNPPMLTEDMPAFGMNQHQFEDRAHGRAAISNTSTILTESEDDEEEVEGADDVDARGREVRRARLRRQRQV